MTAVHLNEDGPNVKTDPKFKGPNHLFSNVAAHNNAHKGAAKIKARQPVARTTLLDQNTQATSATTPTQTHPAIPQVCTLL